MKKWILIISIIMGGMMINVVSADIRLSPEIKHFDVNTSNEIIEVVAGSTFGEYKIRLIPYVIISTMKEYIPATKSNFIFNKLSDTSFKFNTDIHLPQKASYLGFELEVEGNATLTTNGTAIIINSEGSSVLLDFSDLPSVNVAKNNIQIPVNSKNIIIDPSITFATINVKAIAIGALDNYTFAAVWCDDDLDDVTFSIYKTNGTKVINDIDVSTDVGGCAVQQVGIAVLNSNLFAILYSDTTNDDITLAYYNSVGTLQGSQIDVDANVPMVSPVPIAIDSLNTTAVVVAWVDANSDPSWAVYDSGRNKIAGVTTETTTASAWIGVCGINSTHIGITWADTVANDGTWSLTNIDGTNILTASDFTTNQISYTDCTKISPSLIAISYNDWSYTPDQRSTVVYNSGGALVRGPTPVATNGAGQTKLARMNDTIYLSSGIDQTSTYWVNVSVINASSIVIVNGTNISYQSSAAVCNYIFATKQQNSYGICKNHFLVGVVNSATLALVKTYTYNGSTAPTPWNGICGDYELIINSPKTATPLAVVAGNNFSVNISFWEDWYNITKGLTIVNFTVGGVNVTNRQWAHISNGLWELNGTAPLLTGLQNLYIRVNYTTNFVEATELQSINYGSSDTCTYSGTGDWLVSASDNCVIITNTAVDGNIFINGIGSFTVLSNITANSIAIDSNCDLVNLPYDNKLLAIKT